MGRINDHRMAKSFDSEDAKNQHFPFANYTQYLVKMGRKAIQVEPKKTIST